MPKVREILRLPFDHVTYHHFARTPTGYTDRHIVDCQTRWLSRSQTRWGTGIKSTLERLPPTSRSNHYVGTPSSTQYLWVMLRPIEAGV